MGACWTEFGAVCWQPTGLLEPVGLSLGVSVCNLQLFWSLLKVQVLAVCWQPALGLFERVWGCMLATCSFCGAYWSEFGAVCWQPTVRLGACCNEFGEVCLQPTLFWSLLVRVWGCNGLYVGNLQVLWGPLDRVWCCMLATYRSLLGRVWVGLMGAIGPILALYLGNLVFTDTPVLL